MCFRRKKFKISRQQQVMLEFGSGAAGNLQESYKLSIGSSAATLSDISTH